MEKSAAETAFSCQTSFVWGNMELHECSQHLALDKPVMIDWGRITNRLAKAIFRELRKKRKGFDRCELDLILKEIFKYLFDPKNPLRFDPGRIPEGLSLEDGLTYFLLGIAKRTVTGGH